MRPKLRKIRNDLNSINLHNRQAPESKANTQGSCVAILPKVQVIHSRIRKPDNSNDITSDTWKGSKNNRVSKLQLLPMPELPQLIHHRTHAMSHSLNIVTLEVVLPPKQLCHANDELSRSCELSHPNHANQNITWMP